MTSLVVTGVVATTLAGCSTAEVGQPSQTTGSRDASGPLATIAHDPCKVIAASLRQDGRFAAAYRSVLSDKVRKQEADDDRSAGRTCVTHAESLEGPTVSVNAYRSITSPADLPKSGKAMPYAQRTRHRVAGFAAIHTAAKHDGPTHGLCETIVAAAGQPGMGVSVDRHGRPQPGHPNMCAVSDQLLTAVIQDAKEQQ